MKRTLLVLVSLLSLTGAAFAADAARPAADAVQPDNAVTVFKSLKLDADAGIEDSMIEVALAYNKGEGTEINNDMAREYLLRAYKLRNASAAFILGVLEQEGAFGLTDNVQACNWFEKAIALNKKHSGANNNMGVCYGSGEGRKKDDKKAAHYYELAINGNNPKANMYCNLAYFYAKGAGVKKDRKKAKDLCKKGYEMGETDQCSGVWEEFGLGK